jgi:iron complex outermembrane receptor protein
MQNSTYRRVFYSLVVLALLPLQLQAQVLLTGKVLDEEQNALPGVVVKVLETGDGGVTDSDGKFSLEVNTGYPFQILITFASYDSVFLTVERKLDLLIVLKNSVSLPAAVVFGSSETEGRRRSPLEVVEITAKQAPNLATGIYDAAGAHPGIDKISQGVILSTINTRGFNSAVPVRMLQLIDGVDNQSPGLNFPLGNFLGASELDLLRISVVVGASSPQLGPNAFNGAIVMETKNPFFHQGLQGAVKVGERQLTETALRYAHAVKNGNGHEWLAYKLNLYAIRALDWEAKNYDPISDSRVPADNPGRYDAVNVYGDEYNVQFDATTDAGHLYNQPGIGNYYRKGYREVDLVDYQTHNYKASGALHFRLKPIRLEKSPELILSSSLGTGSTIYQGDNRFALRNIKFFQHRVEWRKPDHFFLRAYVTHEDAGQSYDPYFTALQLVEKGKPWLPFRNDYNKYWIDTYEDSMVAMGYPVPSLPPDVTFDFVAAAQWIEDNNDKLLVWHANTLAAANVFLEPGTQDFQDAFNAITSQYNTSKKGTRFFDRSALAHVQGEYRFSLPSKWLEEIRVGGSMRQYRPYSKGTIFSDTTGSTIRNEEYGIYAGLQKTFSGTQPITATATIRFDKNENFKLVPTYAAGIVWQASEQTFVRMSLSSALRNPTLTDQYLNLNVGPAILAGHLQPIDSLITVESFRDYLDFLDLSKLVYFNIPALRPEFVRTIEVGIRSQAGEKWNVEAGAYINSYRHFLGYAIGVDSKFDEYNFPYDVTVYRYTLNSQSNVQTQGATVAIDYAWNRALTLRFNYSYNELIKTDCEDPILPAFNTPRHKFNAGISLTDWPSIRLGSFSKSVFSLNYRWVEGYEFEGSPQFTGNIKSYGVIDAQWNIKSEAKKVMVKIGATNLLNNRHVETYGGPSVGRMGYIQLSYNIF